MNSGELRRADRRSATPSELIQPGLQTLRDRLGRKNYVWKITAGDPGTFKMTSILAPPAADRGEIVTGVSW